MSLRKPELDIRALLLSGGNGSADEDQYDQERLLHGNR
jgi:hypothetical protein